jgi:hypothetical protein
MSGPAKRFRSSTSTAAPQGFVALDAFQIVQPLSRSVPGPFAIAASSQLAAIAPRLAVTVWQRRSEFAATPPEIRTVFATRRRRLDVIVPEIAALLSLIPQD